LSSYTTGGFSRRAQLHGVLLTVLGNNDDRILRNSKVRHARGQYVGSQVPLIEVGVALLRTNQFDIECFWN
jgi:hypothetical protein